MNWPNATAKRRYLTYPAWSYRLPTGESGRLELSNPTGQYAADERFARFLLRLQTNRKRLPAGTSIEPTILALRRAT